MRRGRNESAVVELPPFGHRPREHGGHRAKKIKMTFQVKISFSEVNKTLFTKLTEMQSQVLPNQVGFIVKKTCIVDQFMGQE